jgi:hypothetical protein
MLRDGGTPLNVCSEDWALCAEQLARTTASRPGYLESIAFRACRLVVDTGLHAKGWTRELEEYLRRGRLEGATLLGESERVTGMRNVVWKYRGESSIRISPAVARMVSRRSDPPGATLNDAERGGRSS